MDLQGKPIPQGQHSTKATKDLSATQNPINEPSGPVPKDSLASISATEGGAFSQNRGAEPLGEGADQAVTNTSNTSNATELPPTPVGSLREDQSKKEKYPEALGGQADYPGAHVPESGYVGGSTAAKEELGIERDRQGQS